MMKNSLPLRLGTLVPIFATVTVACGSPTGRERPGSTSTVNDMDVASTGGTSASGGGTGTGGSVQLDLPPAGAMGGAASGSDSCTVAILGDAGANSAANFAKWISDRGPIVRRFAAGMELESLTPAELSQYDVVLLDWLAPETLLGITPEDLGGWVRGGGSLIALSGYGDYSEAVAVQNEMLMPLDLGFVTTEVVWGPVSQFAPHPITEGLTSITFIGGREVTSLAEDAVLMTLNDPPKPVGVAAQRDAGKAFLFGDEWITYDSEWAAVPEIQQMWVNIFDWLADCELQTIVR